MNAEQLEALLEAADATERVEGTEGAEGTDRASPGYGGTGHDHGGTGHDHGGTGHDHGGTGHHHGGTGHDHGGTGPRRDGLRVGHEDEGYYFETPTSSHAGLTEEEFRGVCEENPWFVSNWYYWDAVDRGGAERAFLRWLEDADGSSVPERYEGLAGGRTRTWGQILVRVELGSDGHRVYHVRHQDDAGADLASLDVHADPMTARDLVTYDDRGRYRPLKTAPTLPTGWAVTDLNGADLVRFVDLVYPATVTNWYLERRGELDVDHFRETARRQSGIYDLVEELPVEAVEWLAEACCVDSQCLKRREWDEDEETPLDVPRGDGEFPCREPCSLVVAAARTWTLLEREQPRTYEFELTPSEKEQIEELLDAAADGRTDDVREAEFSDGANRYRARYLRAKRMDEAGRLCGVPTNPGGDEPGPTDTDPTDTDPTDTDPTDTDPTDTDPTDTDPTGTDHTDTEGTEAGATDTENVD